MNEFYDTARHDLSAAKSLLRSISEDDRNRIIVLDKIGCKDEARRMFYGIGQPHSHVVLLIAWTLFRVGRNE